MKSSLTTTFPTPLPVLRVRVAETALANRVRPERVVFGLALLISVAICAGALAWLSHTEIRSVAIQPRLIAPVPALTTDQWMAGLARG